MSQKSRLKQILIILSQATQNMAPPMSALIARDFGREPFLILISCLLSLRARDPMTYAVSHLLFQEARTPEEIVNMNLNHLEHILKPLGFYRRKARIIKEVSAYLIEHYQGHVPSHEEQLLAIPGVGRKTANLVLGEAFGIPAICVDVHVHRIANRLALVTTKKPEETERELKKLVPKEYWIAINRYLVMWGQNICTPLSPRCSICPLSPLCPKIGVNRSR